MGKTAEGTMFFAEEIAVMRELRKGRGRELYLKAYRKKKRNKKQL